VLTAYIIINGIKTDPGQIDGWTDRLVTAINTLSQHKAQAAEYYTGALNRRVGHAERVRKVAKMIGYYQRRDYAVHIVAHSHGALVATDALSLRDRFDAEVFAAPVASLHLFAPAVDAEEVADALEDSNALRVRVCWAPGDPALKLGRLSRRLFGWIKVKGRPLGYGSLGLDPSWLQARQPGRVQVETYTGFKHSTWFEPAHFDATVEKILHHDNP